MDSERRNSDSTVTVITQSEKAEYRQIEFRESESLLRRANAVRRG